MVYAFYDCANLQISATDVPDLSRVAEISSMFSGCTILDGPANIGSWDMSGVTSMYSVFENASSFNQLIGGWTMSGVTDMAYMFSNATAFNQPVDNWDTRNVENMGQMFMGASSFNQLIGNRDTRNVTDMGYMFKGAGAFDQSLGNWTLNASVNLNVIFNNSGLSCYNYSETLKGWSANPDTPDELSLDADGRTYGPGTAEAREYLLTAKGWTIVGDAVSDTECSRPLPVTLVSFSGQKNNENQNVLEWTTANESDFERFEVQRSEDALSFEKIGDVYGKAEYIFTDQSPGFSNYYRLKMIDLDGSYEYSRIISIKNAGKRTFVGSFYPNASSGKVRVDVNAPENGRWALTVVDINGKSIAQRAYDLRKGKNTITLEHLAEGIHFVRFEYGRFSEVRKLIGF